MKLYGFGSFSSVVSLIVLAAFSAPNATTKGYHLLKKYGFGAAEGSTREYFDYVTVDSAARRVYLSHGTEVKVIDADSGAPTGDITGLNQVSRIALASEFGRGSISDGGAGKVIIFDLQTFKGTSEAKADKDAECVIYDPFSKRVFAMNGDPHSSTVLEAKDGSIVGTIDLGGCRRVVGSCRRGLNLTAVLEFVQLGPSGDVQQQPANRQSL